MFDSVKIWLQMWGLPTHRKTLAVGRKLTKEVGEVHEVALFESNIAQTTNLKAIVSF